MNNNNNTSTTSTTSTAAVEREFVVHFQDDDGNPNGSELFKAADETAAIAAAESYLRWVGNVSSYVSNAYELRPVWFVTRHEPTPEQYAFFEHGNLVRVDDIDAFKFAQVSDLFAKVRAERIREIVVVNAALALQLAKLANTYKYSLSIGVWENAKRPAEGGKPTFYPKSILWMHFE